VLDLLELRSEDSMDDEEQLRAQHMIYAEDLAERFLERDTRELAERAAADRDWTYRHIVVDEAQELSEMDWRVLMRRCPGRSFTVVGDLAQRRSAAGATSWAAMLEPYVPGRWAYPGGDHDRGRGAARRVRARRPATGVGSLVRNPALVAASRRG
jgi:DNA helicase IV